MPHNLPRTLQFACPCSITQSLHAPPPLKSGLLKTCIFYSWQGLPLAGIGALRHSNGKGLR